MPRSWSQSDDEALRGGWGKIPTRQLAKEIGRSSSAVKQRAAKLGLDSGRYWSIEEIKIVRDHYHSHTAPQIAVMLGLQPRAALNVYKIAAAIGLRKLARLDDELLNQVGELHAKGLNDVEIAKRLGSTRDTIHHVRFDRLRLPMVEDACSEARRRGVKTQFARLGVSNAAELRSLAYRKYAAENGWPEDLRPREVQILNVLSAQGVPMTRQELAAAIGMKSKPEDYGRSGQRKLLAGNGPGGSYPASLARRGLVTILWRSGPQCKATGKGNGRRVNLYALGPAALAIIQERAESCRKENAK